MVACKNCEHCDVITDDEYCKRLKCTATKRGKTLTWTMCCIDSNGTPMNALQYFADYVEKHTHPKWCPKVVKEETANDEI